MLVFILPSFARATGYRAVNIATDVAAGYGAFGANVAADIATGHGSLGADIASDGLAGYRAAGDNDGSAPLSAVGSQLLLIKPDFDPREYGHKQLSALFAAMDKQFALDRSGKTVTVRLKPKAFPEPRFPPLERPS
jgi:hypothetical protein